MNRLILLIFCFVLFSSSVFCADELDDTSFLPEIIEEPYVHDKYNYEAVDKVTVKLKVVSGDVSTKKGHGYEGQILDLRVKQNVKYKGKIIIKNNTPATGIVSNIRTHGMNGIPAAIIIDNIQIEGVDRDKLTSNYTERGANLSLLVFPIKWALTPFPPTGSLTNFMLGGHAKINQNTVIKVDYYPDWGKDL
ncbi:hypothetical protein II906_06820 [bacterium]|nr:hypothetical protein [bacterium]